MFKKSLLQSLLLIFVLSGFVSSARAQECGPITRTELKALLIQMGHSPKEISSTPGKEKWEVTHSYNGFTIPVGYEISPSTNYIWLTVNLGNAQDSLKIVNHALLKQNGVIQPCQFYISSSGKLMMGLALENRGVTEALLRKNIDMITKNVSNTSTYWKQ